MTALDYFYKLGQEQAIKELADPVVKNVLHIDPAVISDLYGEEPHIVRDRSLYFAKNFLRSRAALEEKLLRMALRKGLNTAQGTAEEGASALSGPPKR